MPVEIIDSVDKLKNILYRLLCREGYTIACVGTLLRSDDRAGLEVCNRVRNLDTIYCEYGLENCLSEIIGKRVEKLLIVDAVVIEGVEPGTIVLTSFDKVSESYLATTHNIPVHMIVKYLRLNGLAKDILLLGIRVGNLEIGEKLSGDIARAVDIVVDALNSIRCS